MNAFSELSKQHYPGQKFSATDKKIAGKKLKQSKQAAIDYLADKGTPKDEFLDFRPPAKCNIVAQSRPFEEWEIYKASVAFQKHIYALPQSELPVAAKLSTEEPQVEYFRVANIDRSNFSSMKGWNLIIQHTIKTYNGVITKVNNRNTKNRENHENEKKLKVNIEEFIDCSLRGDIPEKATNETGHLIQPPGINQSIYCYQDVSPKVLDPEKQSAYITTVYAGYSRKPADILPIGTLDRLSIPQGQPGYIPEWQRSNIKTKGRIRRRANKNLNALLGYIRIGDDWVVFDMRGLLRNALWRKLILPHQKIICSDLLKLFTGDPVIDTKRSLISFSYKEGVVHSVKPIHGKKSKEFLVKLTEKKSVCLISIDLGQTNPAAIRFSRIQQKEGMVELTYINSSFLEKDELQKIEAYRKKSDDLEKSILEQAILSLSAAQQEEIKAHQSICADKTKSDLCAALNVDIATIAWDTMNSYSTIIADHIISDNKDQSLAYFYVIIKEKTKKLKVMDKRFANQYKPKLSKETRTLLNEAKWNIQKTSPEYNKLAQYKKELVRSMLNRVSNDGRKVSQCDTIVYVIEDLDQKSSFFDGKGKQENGWSGFFTSKKENRWFVKAFHKTISELPKHQGINVIKVNPARTSQTCPIITCGYCDPGNRNGEKFICLKCNATFNTDLEVATANIERVAISGISMPKSEVRAVKRRTKGGERSQSGKVADIVEQNAERSGKNGTDEIALMAAKTDLSQTGT